MDGSARAEAVRCLTGAAGEVLTWKGPPLWLHGDPHPANLLIRHRAATGLTRLAAVLDFGDLAGGDPATDLAAAWLVFDADARAESR